jgi:hypothetical protein
MGLRVLEDAALRAAFLRSEARAAAKAQRAQAEAGAGQPRKLVQALLQGKRAGSRAGEGHAEAEAWPSRLRGLKQHEE